MSGGKVRQLAASLAVACNGGMVTKGFAATITADHLMPVARSLVKMERQTAKMNAATERLGKQIARNGELIASMSGPPAVTAIPAADVMAAAEATQLARLRQMHLNGTDRHLPTTNGRPDVPPHHPG